MFTEQMATGVQKTREEILPFLVYGTLRPNEGNYAWAILPYPHTYETVKVDGFEMLGKDGFPYVVPAEGKKIVAELVEFLGSDEEYYARLRALDGLEGYRGPGSPYNHYDRIIVEVDTATQKGVRAYIYVAASDVGEDARRRLPVIEHGDWLRNVEERNRERALSK